MDTLEAGGSSHDEVRGPMREVDHDRGHDAAGRDKLRRATRKLRLMRRFISGAKSGSSLHDGDDVDEDSEDEDEDDEDEDDEDENEHDDERNASYAHDDEEDEEEEEEAWEALAREYRALHRRHALREAFLRITDTAAAAAAAALRSFPLVTVTVGSNMHDALLAVRPRPLISLLKASGSGNSSGSGSSGSSGSSSSGSGGSDNISSSTMFSRLQGSPASFGQVASPPPFQWVFGSFAANAKRAAEATSSSFSASSAAASSSSLLALPVFLFDDLRVMVRRQGAWVRWLGGGFFNSFYGRGVSAFE